jgi:hypothetical protein
VSADIIGSTRALFWDGHWGVVFANGHYGPLDEVPHIEGLNIEAIDYAPLVPKRMVLERGGVWRELTDVEAAKIERKFDRGTTAFRAVWRKP